MSPWLIILCVFLAASFVFLLLGFVLTLRIAKRLYFKWFVKDAPDKFPRGCSLPGDPGHLAMYEDGMAFAEKQKTMAQDVSLLHDGLRLMGVFLDHGKKKTVIIIPGRAETVNYSFYFAELYQNTEFNVLLIDPRAFGLSEGRYMTAGIQEAGDLLAWAAFLHEERKQESVYFHGICVGGATALLALAKRDVPSYVAGAVVEAPFLDFEKMFYHHTVQEGHLTFPVVNEISCFFRHYAKVSIIKDSPSRRVRAIRKPVLFLQGREDVFAPFQETEKLFAACGSPEKKIIFYDHGRHSHLRQANLKEYDADVLSFWRSLHG
jgi:alpha-beta hydrolase superfamily lysophospholipase